MRSASFIYLIFATHEVTGLDSAEGDAGISLSFSKKTTKGHAEPSDDSEEHHQETKTTTLSSISGGEQGPRREDSSHASAQSAETENSGDSSGGTTTNDRDSVQSVDDASTRSFAIAHQTELFIGNLQNVTFTIAELSLEAVNAAVHIRTLSSYTELLIKSLEHFEILESEEQRFYWQLKDTVSVRIIACASRALLGTDGIYHKGRTGKGRSS